MTFDVKNQKMPALLTGDLESYSEEIRMLMRFQRVRSQ